MPSTTEQSYQSITVNLSGQNHSAVITLNRPEVHNAFNDTTIAELTDAIVTTGNNESVRSIVLAAEGKSYSAGADLNWMKAMASYSFEENVADARKLYGLMSAIRNSAKPVIARVQGAAYGGGVGLIAACDMAVATPNATFAFTETKLGLVPAVISPFVIGKIGAGACRQLFTTAERFDANDALRLGLVNAVAENETELDEWVTLHTKLLAKNAPSAVTHAKQLIDAVSTASPDAMETLVSEWIANERGSAEGQEGMGAFLEKRPPSWISSN